MFTITKKAKQYLKKEFTKLSKTTNKPCEYH